MKKAEDWGYIGIMENRTETIMMGLLGGHIDWLKIRS